MFPLSLRTRPRHQFILLFEPALGVLPKLFDVDAVLPEEVVRDGFLVGGFVEGPVVPEVMVVPSAAGTVGKGLVDGEHDGIDDKSVRGLVVLVRSLEGFVIVVLVERGRTRSLAFLLLLLFWDGLILPGGSCGGGRTGDGVVVRVRGRTGYRQRTGRM